MEVTLLDASNPPLKPMVAIHAGSVKRQVRMEVNRNFEIPHPGSPTASMQVCLLSKITSSSLPAVSAEKDVTCSIPVRNPDGEQSEVKLRIRRLGDEANKSSPTPGSAISADPLKPEEIVGVTRNYLDSHRVQDRIQSLIQDVLKVQPADPFRYMLQSLLREKGAPPPLPQSELPVAEASAEAKAGLPLAPRPPEGPRPAGRGSLRKEMAKVSPNGEQQKAEEVAAAEAAKAIVAAQPAQVMVPVPPETPQTGGAPRKGRLSASSSSKEKPAVLKGIAREAARASINLLLQGPIGHTAVEQAIREKTQCDFSGGVAKQALVLALRNLDAETQRQIDEYFPASKQKVAHEARASILGLYTNTVELNRPENKRAIVLATVELALRSASALLRREEEQRSGSMDFGRRLSEHVPIVNLDVGTASWSAWLGPR